MVAKSSLIGLAIGSLAFWGGLTPLFAGEDPAKSSVATPATQTEKKASGMSPQAIFDLTMSNIEGKPVKFSAYKGKVLLVVNTASKCGYTPQYQGLEALYRQYRKEKFEVLAFPSNDFGGQEPGTNEEIKQFCKTEYDVTFPLFSKIVVKGEKKHPLYKFLTDKEANPKFGGEVKWNFTKFLIGRDGTVLARFESKVAPKDESLRKALEAALAVPAEKASSADKATTEKE